MAPVNDIGRNETRVGNNDGDIVVSPDGSAAGRNMNHVAIHVAHFDTITNFDRPFEQDYNAADEVVRDVLQTKTDTDTHRTGDKGERTKVDAHGGQSHHEADHQHEVLCEG